MGDDELAATPFGSLPMVPEANMAFVSSHLWPTSTDGMDLRESAAFDDAGPTIEPATLGLRLDFVDPSRPFHVAVTDATGDTRPCFISLVGAESDADPFDASLVRTRYSLLLADAAEEPNTHPASREEYLCSTPSESVLTATCTLGAGSIESAALTINNTTLSGPLTALPGGQAYSITLPRLSWCVLDVTTTQRMPQFGRP